MNLVRLSSYERVQRASKPTARITNGLLEEGQALRAPITLDELVLLLARLFVCLGDGKEHEYRIHRSRDECSVAFECVSVLHMLAQGMSRTAAPGPARTHRKR